MKIFCLILFAVPFLLFADYKWTQELDGGFLASVYIPTTRISIDEELTFQVSLKYPPTYEPDIDTIRMNLLKYVGVSEPPFALKDEKIESLKTGEMKITFHLEPQLAKRHFLSLYNIPFIPVEEDSKERKTIISDIFEIEVYLPEVEPAWHGSAIGLLSLTEPFPINLNHENRQRIYHPDRIREEGKKSASIVSSRSIPWTRMMGVLLFCMFVFIARMQPKRRDSSEKAARKKALSAKSRALGSLSALDASNKEKFYVDLTNTVRQFIEDKFHMRTTSQTTEEFLYEMANNPSFDHETQAMLSDFLSSSDRVKFADHDPSREDCQKALQTAKQFIHQHS